MWDLQMILSIGCFIGLLGLIIGLVSFSILLFLGMCGQ